MSSDPSSTLPLDALRQVATAVAANGEPSEVFELVARATRELLDVDSAGVVRYEGPTPGRVMGQAGIAMPHRRFTLLGDNTAAVTARTGLPSYVTDLAALGACSRWSRAASRTSSATRATGPRRTAATAASAMT